MIVVTGSEKEILSGPCSSSGCRDLRFQRARATAFVNRQFFEDRTERLVALWSKELVFVLREAC